MKETPKEITQSGPGVVKRKVVKKPQHRGDNVAAFISINYLWK